MGFPRTGISLFGLGVALLALPAGLAFSQSVDWNSQSERLEGSPALIEPPRPALRPALAGQPDSLLAGLGVGGGEVCADLDAQFFDTCVDSSPGLNLDFLPSISDISSTSGMPAAGVETVAEQVGTAELQQDFEPNPQATHPPVPLSASLRPILEVYPHDVSLIQSVRSVSGDPLVHQQVKGSWPRRLDRVNMLTGAEKYAVAQGAEGSSFLKAWLHAQNSNQGVPPPK